MTPFDYAVVALVYACVGAVVWALIRIIIFFMDKER